MVRLVKGVFNVNLMYPEGFKGDYNPFTKKGNENPGDDRAMSNAHKCHITGDKATKKCYSKHLCYFLCMAPLRDQDGNFRRDKTGRVVCCWERSCVNSREGCHKHKYSNSEVINGRVYQYNKEFKRVLEGATLDTLKDEYYPWYLDANGEYNYGKPGPCYQAKFRAPENVSGVGNVRPVYSAGDVIMGMQRAEAFKDLTPHDHKLKQSQVSSVVRQGDMNTTQAKATIRQAKPQFKNQDRAAEIIAEENESVEMAKLKQQRADEKRQKLQEIADGSPKRGKSIKKKV